MKSAGNGGVFNGSLRVLYIQVLVVAPLGASHMAKSGTDQHEGRVAVWEAAHHTSTMADLPVKSLNGIIGADASPVLAGKVTLYYTLSDSAFYRVLFY